MAKKFDFEKDMIPLFRKSEPYLKVDSTLSFRERGIKKRIPSIVFNYEGDSIFYSPDSNTITFGIKGIYNIFKPESPEIALMSYTFASGHEEQHFRSTASIPYAYGINGGAREIVAYAYEQATGKRKIFRGDNDVAQTANELGSKYGIYLDANTVYGITAGLTNSLEDGRIERIRSYRVPEFRDLREVFRYRIWKSNEITNRPTCNSREGELLLVLTNQVLSLSTTYRFEKGFYKHYRDDKEMMGYINKIIPHVQKAIMSPGTRGMAEESVEIAKILAPIIYKVARIPDAFVDLLKLLAELISQAESTSEMSAGSGGLMENDEEQEGGLDENSMNSDLFESMNSNSSSSNPGDSDKKSSGNSAGNDDGEAKENGSNPLAEDNSDSEDSKDSKSSSESNKSSSNPDEWNNPARGSGGAGSDGDKTAEPIEDVISRAIARSNVFINSIDQASSKATTSTKAKMRDESKVKPEKPVDEKAMGKLAKCRFKEEKRKYEVNKPLPPIVAAQGKTLHRANAKYFKSLATPNVRYLDKGIVDPSRIYGLACGDYDIFKRNGKPNNVDFCAYILLDNSGSMGGADSEKRVDSALAAAMVEEGFKGLMPLKICAFDTRSTIRHVLIKDWNENFNCNAAYNFLVQGGSQFGCGNDDDKDIIIATDELLKRPESNKLLIYTSDGAPSNITATANAISAARAKGIKVCGIYFDTYDTEGSSFKKIVQKDYVICPPKDINKNLQLIFKRFSRGRM